MSVSGPSGEVGKDLSDVVGVNEPNTGPVHPVESCKSDRKEAQTAFVDLVPSFHPKEYCW